MTKYRYIVLTYISVIAFGFNCCTSKSSVKTLRLAHGLDTRHPVHKAMELMGQKLSEVSEGKMELMIYPSGQLGRERECLELLQIGSLDITKVSAAVLENFIPEYKVFGIPYIFRDKQHTFQVLDGKIGEEMLNKGQDYRLKGLTFYDAGSRSFYTKTNPIKTPQDLDDLKIRVMKSNMAIQMVDQLGGAPAPISWGELYTALQQGVVDGAENNPPSFYSSKHYEVCKFYSLDEHTAVPDVLMIGLDSWSRLSEEERKWLIEACEYSKEEQRRLWATAEKTALEEVQKAGVTVLYPDKTLFEQKTKASIEQFRDDQPLMSIIKAIKEI